MHPPDQYTRPEHARPGPYHVALLEIKIKRPPCSPRLPGKEEEGLGCRAHTAVGTGTKF